MIGNIIVTLPNLRVGLNLNQFKNYMCLARESREYHSKQSLLTEVWQYMKEWQTI